MKSPIHRVVDLVEPTSQQIFNMDHEQARDLLVSEQPEATAAIQGSFALVARDKERVYLARSLDRPLRYFLAKEVSGPLLVVAERIDEIRDFLESEGYGEQFHPSYTRMVPAHHVTTIQLVGCPDPNPSYERFVAPETGDLPADLDVIGERYVGTLRQELAVWLRSIPTTEPLGVLFSGGVDSGTVLLAVYQLLLGMGQSPARLKAFTLSVDGGADLEQARAFLRQLDLELRGEPGEGAPDLRVSWAAVEVIAEHENDGPPSRRKLDAMMLLARFAYRAAHFDEAISVSLEVLDEAEERFPDCDPLTAMSLSTLARAYFAIHE